MTVKPLNVGDDPALVEVVHILSLRAARNRAERLDVGSVHVRTHPWSWAPPASHRVARPVDVQCRRPDRPARDIVLQLSY
jgi:hypothetical protein